jgi:hypothetical protein
MAGGGGQEEGRGVCYCVGGAAFAVLALFLGRPGQKMPHFPWPPPKASAMVVIPGDFLRKTPGKVCYLGDVERKIHAALESSGCFEKSYYGVPDGFAMVARLEQINRDGTPKEVPDRWAGEV